MSSNVMCDLSQYSLPFCRESSKNASHKKHNCYGTALEQTYDGDVKDSRNNMTAGSFHLYGRGTVHGMLRVGLVAQMGYW